MGLVELFLLALGLSMDAFAVAICAGLANKGSRLKNMLEVGLYFGLFQAGMPLIGFYLSSRLVGSVLSVGHWLAAGLLFIIGARMIISSAHKNPSCVTFEYASSLKLLSLAVATSVDALVAGVSFAFLDVSIFAASVFIGVITFTLSCVGVAIGAKFGLKFKSAAEAIGGALLISIGVKTLFENAL
ncbi:MAG: manganese efflux pump MntP family protein [Clostridiales bacterium]|jgi:putative Mn2+ efflux pump MntP|nr:manganese efflux pump MntP family protein [Clostridiales bacterium]